MLVLNAGIFPATQAHRRISRAENGACADRDQRQRTPILRSCRPAIRCSSSRPRGGRVVVIGSKNVPAPGPGAAAYSASKAALTQLARVAALEWGADGIRVNVAAPQRGLRHRAVDREVLAARARRTTG